jgi:cytochrome d ubiquinol oxidase subunit I
MVFLGSLLSGFFIIVADAWMQHPVGYSRLPDGSFQVTSASSVIANPWAWIQSSHVMSGAVITGSFVMAATGAYYLLSQRHEAFARLSVRCGVIVGLIASAAQIFPTGDMHGKYMARHQPVTTAAMEALFHTEAGSPLVILGQPDVEHQRIDNPIIVNDALSFLIYGTRKAAVPGLDQFPQSNWPTNIPLLYFAYHVMAGLGTLFLALLVVAAFLLFRGTLFETRWFLWCLMLAFPFPYIANTAGWMTAEVGRQPWLVYGLLRTDDGFSANVSAGNGLFTLLGFMGLYALLTVFFLFLMYRHLEEGPVTTVEEPVTVSGAGI